MRADERDSHDRILAAAGARHERELPGEAQRALRILVRYQPGTAAGIGALVDFARTAGYVDALADVDALGQTVADVRDLPEAGPRP